MSGIGGSIAITGGSGFIGQPLSARLAPRVDVRIVDIVVPANPGSGSFVHADVCDIDGLIDALRGCSQILHLAAAHRDDVRPTSRYFDVNVGGTGNICVAARQLGITRILFTSTVATYGFQSGTPDESAPLNPFNEYGESKCQAENALRAWHAEDPTRRELVILRFPAVFGPGNRGNVYNLISQLSRGSFVMVGDGMNRKSMAYVENVAAFIGHLASMPERAGLRLYNYCDTPDLTMNELLRIVREALNKGGASRLRLPLFLGLAGASMIDLISWLTGRTFSISRIRVRKFCATTVFASDRMRETGFVPPFALEEGLVRTIKAEFGSQ